MKSSIFISHKHDDKRFADVFKKHFLLWNVPLASIFQSSDFRTSAAIGEPLKPQLKAALAKAGLVLLIYTDSEKDWGFCLWECGVATDPTDDAGTRVALFQAADQANRVFQDEIIFRSELEDIKKFTEQFHKKKGFVSADEAFQPEVQPEIIQKRAEDLFTELQSLSDSIPGKVEERYRWDFFKLALSLDHVNRVSAMADSEEIMSFLLESSQVVHSFGQSLLHFNYTAGTKNLTFGKLVQRWKDAVQGLERVPQGWIKEICDEMVRSIKNIPAKPAWELMKSVLFDGWWFYPIVNHARVLSDGGFEFEIYMYRFPGALPTEVETEQE